MLKKILIIPYFGKFNNYFELWLKSCEYNTDFDWLIFTDDKTNYQYPENVHVHYTTFENIKDRINNLFEFEISLDSPYKLCDFKPAAYRTLTALNCYSYKEVFTDRKNYAFDEWGSNKGLNRILLENNFKIYNRPICFADICIHSYGLKNTRIYYDSNEVKKRNIVFLFNRGELLQYYLDENGNLKYNQESYIHLQKRPMVNNVKNKETFLIVPPNKFINCSGKITDDFLLSIRENKIYWHYLKIRYNNLIRKIKGLVKK